MKRVFTFVILMIVIFSPITISAQSSGGCGYSGPEHYFNTTRTSHPERLTLLFNHEMVLTIETMEILEIPSGLDSHIDNLHRHIQHLSDSLYSFATPLLISFSNIDRNLARISAMPDTTAVFETVYNKAELSYAPTGFRYTIIYPLNYKHTLVVYANDLRSINNLADISIDSLIFHAKEHTKSLDIKRVIEKSCTYPITDNRVDTAGAHIRRNADRGLSVAVNLGFSHLNNTFVPSLSIPILFFQSRKNKQDLMFGIAFDQLLMPDKEKEYKISNNWYADAQIRFEHPRTTLFAGYLIHREGDLLPPNACRAGLDIGLGKSQLFSIRAAYHFSVTQPSKALIEFGVRFGM